MLKKTALHGIHRSLGAKMVPFAGWEMPVNYPTGVIEEHLAVRRNAGLFDVSHMGQVRVGGKEALSFIQYLTTNDAALLTPGQVQYTIICYPNGGTVDDTTLYRLGEEEYLFCVNASRCDEDFAWMKTIAAERGFNIRLENLSDDYGLLALQGPAAAAILAKITGAGLAALSSFHFIEGETAGVKALISRTGYTGEDGFELYLPASETATVWSALLDAGKENGLLPVGLGARDTLRLEKKYALYGHELGPDITPLEAGLGWVVRLEKADFNGKAALEEIKRNGIPRQLVCLKMEEAGIPREKYLVYDGDRPIGTVTSGTLSPSLRQGIAIALVAAGAWKPGRRLQIEIHGRKRSAVIVKPPFYPPREGG
ncbi:MAG: glycine cleavage system aminomethyltransferase GcvT [Desulfuromonadaceae bacterium]|nr:glycine cleavage system aminomethyltransferase GcvT [Desulfuromonadaceae bacterium]